MGCRRRGAFAVAVGLVAAPGCGAETEPNPVPEALGFPEGFVFGSAIAGFQVDMGCPSLPAAQCEDQNSDWYVFVTDPTLAADNGTYLSGQAPAVGPGHWELYEQDLNLVAKELHHQALRFSFEWSRVFPTPTDGIEGHDALEAIANKDAIAHYHAVLGAMKARGIRPLVTLNHYTLPTWIHDTVGCHANLETCTKRGWVDKDRTVKEIAKYAGFVAEEFGSEIDTWATLNEPFAVLLSGYIYPTPDRSNPPALALKFEAAKTVMVALVEAHARMYDAVKAADTGDADGDGVASEVGVVYPMVPFKAANPAEPLDVKGAENAFYLWNLVYLNGVVKGDLDAELNGTSVHRADLENRMDYVGINYYTRATVEGTSDPFLPDLSPLTTFNMLTIQLWEDYPRGIYEMAMKVKEMGLPAIITENGTSDPDDDGTGPSFLVRDLTWLSRAIRDGADVRGYFYWTLMDNYEWNHGMDIRMGLYAVDKDDIKKTRIARKAAIAYGEIAAARSIPPELAEKYPAPR